MLETNIPEKAQHISPAGAEVRLLANNVYGGMAHCTLRVNSITRAVRHKTVSEFWHILSGSGSIWRCLGEREVITELSQGITIDIPVGAKFQYRSGSAEDLVFICVTMPPWSGHDEAVIEDRGAWEPNVSD